MDGGEDDPSPDAGGVREGRPRPTGEDRGNRKKRLASRDYIGYNDDTANVGRRVSQTGPAAGAVRNRISGGPRSVPSTAQPYDEWGITQHNRR